MPELSPDAEMRSQQITPTPAELDFGADPSMEDHEMLIEHVAQHDHELYGLDCCLSEMLAV